MKMSKKIIHDEDSEISIIKKVKKNISEEENDNDNDNDISHAAEDEYDETYVKTSIMSYLKYDSVIKDITEKYKKDIANLKVEKKKLESVLDKHFVHTNTDFIKIGEKQQILRIEKEKKIDLSKSEVKRYTIEELQTQKIANSEEDAIKIVDKLFETLESKKQIKKTVSIRIKTSK